MQNILHELEKLRIIPVVAVQNPRDANPLGNALINGGLPCAEIAFRTSAAGDAIRVLAERRDMLLGAGTVLKIDQVREAVDAGARFIVSPGFNPKVVGYCVENGISVIPGISTPTDIEMALDFDLKVVKFFPAEAFGGLETLKAISAPYNMIRFIPTGGVGPHNLLDYLRFPKVIACGGSWIVKAGLIEKRDFGEIERRTREAVTMVTSLALVEGKTPT